MSRNTQSLEFATRFEATEIVKYLSKYQRTNVNLQSLFQRSTLNELRARARKMRNRASSPHVRHSTWSQIFDMALN